MHVHVDHPWSKCAKDGAPYRIYVRTSRGYWMIGAKSQVFDNRTEAYTERWAHINYRRNIRAKK